MRTGRQGGSLWATYAPMGFAGFHETSALLRTGPFHPAFALSSVSRCDDEQATRRAEGPRRFQGLGGPGRGVQVPYRRRLQSCFSTLRPGRAARGSPRSWADGQKLSPALTCPGRICTSTRGPGDLSARDG